MKGGLHMNKARRSFISYMSILGFAGVSGMSLQAYSFAPIGESLGHTRFDAEFDPEGWL